MLEAPFDAPDWDRLAIGLQTGVVALAVGLALHRAERGRGWTYLPVGGLVLTGSALVAMVRSDLADVRLATGVGALGLLGLLGDRIGRWWPAVLLPAVPVAWWLVPSPTRRSLWIEPAAVATIVVSGALLAADRRRLASGLAVALFPISLVGVYITVPETDWSIVALGATLPLIFLGWPVPVVSFGVGGALAASGLLAWVTVSGGDSRHGSIVGGLACLGLLVLEPVARLLAGGRSLLDRIHRPWLSTSLAAFAHITVVILAARVAGLRAEAAEAAAIVALIAGVSISVLVVGARVER
ncbi:MAG TPA: hypothetical protein DCS55_15070 [Acidimicrobiaceae bacterium]|nr:hypothetical protein [Acidimicrobiaceae bacterium]